MQNWSVTVAEFWQLFSCQEVMECWRSLRLFISDFNFLYFLIYIFFLFYFCRCLSQCFTIGNCLFGKSKFFSVCIPSSTIFHLNNCSEDWKCGKCRATFQVCSLPTDNEHFLSHLIYRCPLCPFLKVSHTKKGLLPTVFFFLWLFMRSNPSLHSIFFL